MFCRHYPVVTLGRASQPEDVFGWSGETVEVQRGGRATYHGPSQLTVYPIVDLRRRKRNVTGYLRTLEELLLKYLKERGVLGQTVAGETGIWVGEEPHRRKIASIGIAVKNWITYHGFSLNLEDDPEAFKGINPCGFSAATMTCLEREMRQKVQWGEELLRIEKHLSLLVDTNGELSHSSTFNRIDDRNDDAMRDGLISRDNSLNLGIGL